MKHKDDAIKNAEDIISAHVGNGLELKRAIRAALTTVEFLSQGSGRFNDSLTQRTLNYIRFLIMGEENSLRLHELEIMLRKQYSIFNNSEIKAERNKAEVEISLMVSEMNQLKKINILL